LKEFEEIAKHFNQAFDAGLKAAKINPQQATIDEIIELYKELDTENKQRVRDLLEEVCTNCNGEGYYYTIGDCTAPVSECCGGCETKHICEECQ
jgi:hypothetical protein